MDDLKAERQKLEAAYCRDSSPPWWLLLRILIFGTIGVFCAITTARTVAPNVIPQIQIVYPKSNDKAI